MSADRLIVSVATRGRSELFRECLSGLAALRPPTEASLAFVFVQNDAGFDIDHEWQPKKNAAIFIVGRKR